MIANSQNKNLVISFSLGLTTIDKRYLDNVQVYINNVINSDFTIDTKGLRVTELTNGGFVFIAEENLAIQIQATNSKGIVLNSNIINLNIVPYLMNNRKVKWNSMIIKFNN